MNILDYFLVLCMAAAAMAGFRLGFVSRGVSWIALFVGLVVGARLSAPVVRLVNTTNQKERLLLAVAVLAITALAFQGLGLALESKLARLVTRGPLAIFDKTLAAITGIVLVLAVVWLFIPMSANVPGVVSRVTRQSAIVQAIGRNTPNPPSALDELKKLIGSSDFPLVYANIAASPNVGAPPQGQVLTSSVIQKAEQSTVKVTGIACNRVQEGSGFVAFSKDLVITNAHVVAGEARTFVLTPNGQRAEAIVIAFNPKIDIAVLSVPTLSEVDPSEVPLGLSVGVPGELGAVIGHPGGVDQIVVSPAEIARERTAIGRDLYNAQNTSRDVLILAAQLHPGNSGGPLIDSQGKVMGVAFAIAPDQPDTSYALTTQEVTTVYNSTSFTPVGTGPCISE